MSKKRLTVGELHKAMESLPDDAPVYVALAGSEESWSGIVEALHTYAGCEGWEGNDVEPGPNLAITAEGPLLKARPLVAKLEKMRDKLEPYSSHHDWGIREGVERAIKVIWAELAD